MSLFLKIIMLLVFVLQLNMANSILGIVLKTTCSAFHQICYRLWMPVCFMLVTQNLENVTVPPKLKERKCLPGIRSFFNF